MVMIKRTYRRQPTNDFLLSPSLITKKRRPASFYLGYDEEEEQLARRKKIKWQQTKAKIALLAAACHAVMTASIPQPISPPTVRKRLDWDLEVDQFQREGHDEE